jgi:hypothetical protein
MISENDLSGQEKPLVGVTVLPAPNKLLTCIMLDEWLRPMSIGLFARDYLRKNPYASPSSAHSATRLFEWSTLERLLTQHPAADVLVVARGKLIDTPTPCTLAEAQALLAEGVGLVIRRAEQHEPALAKLAAALTKNIPGEVHVQLFVTPAGTHGFGWHHDDEDRFHSTDQWHKGLLLSRQHGRALSAAGLGTGFRFSSRRNLAHRHDPPDRRRLVIHSIALVARG